MGMYHIVTQDEFDRIISGTEPKPDKFNPIIVAPWDKARWALGARNVQDANVIPAADQSPGT